MYKQILLTLDTSEFAERAIPHAVAAAKAFDASLCILSVVPVMNAEGEGANALAASIDWDTEVAHTEEYLAGIQQAFKAQGVEARIELRRGNVTEEILIFSEKIDE